MPHHDAAHGPVPVVPGYVLEERLGRGGTGEVWRARSRPAGDPVAVKVLVAGEPDRQQREAELLAELDHPHLVRLHEVVRRQTRDGVQVALVLDLLAGGSLAALLARRGRLRPGEVVTAIAPVAAALAHVHDRGIVHGDLAPGNVVFTAEGRPVLTDLGVGRALGEPGPGEVTPPYVDPVVARGGAPGPASDVFGVAAAAFHALTGVPPWNAAGAASTLAVAARGEVPDLALLAPAAPRELIAVVERGLSLHPHLRGSAAEFALDLRHACQPERISMPAPGVPDEGPGRAGQVPRTELTHRVRRAPGAHAAPTPAARGRWRRVRFPADRSTWRALGGRVATTVAVLAVLSGAGWLGVQWGGGGPGAAVPAASTTKAPAPTTGAGTPTQAPGSPASSSTAPEADVAGWTAVLGELYGRRAAAFGALATEGLAAVYSDGSGLLAADAGRIAELLTAGARLEGFAPEVLSVDAVGPTGDGGVQLQLTDRIPPYAVVDADGTRHPVAERGARPVVMVLRPVAEGWRIESATLVG